MSIEAILRETVRFLRPLEASFASPENFKALLEHLGFDRPESDLSPIASDLVAVVKAASHARELVAAYTRGEIPDVKPQELLGDVLNALEAVNALGPALESVSVPADIVPELLDLLLANYIAARAPALFHFLVVVGVVELKPGVTREVEYRSLGLRWERLPRLLTAPEALLDEVYGWSTPAFDHQLLLYRIGKFAESLNLAVMTDEPESVFQEMFLPSAARTADKPWILKIPIFQEEVEDVDAEVYFGLLLSPIEGNSPEDLGICVMPQLEGSLAAAAPLTDEAEVFLSGGAELAGGIVASFRPQSRFAVNVGVLNNAIAQGTFRFGVRRAETEPIIIFGRQGEIRFETLRLETAVYAHTGGNGADFGAEVLIEGGAFIIESSGPDAFLSKVLPEDPIVVSFDLATGMSLDRGLYFGGEAAIEVTIPLHLNIDPVSVDSLYLSVAVIGGSDVQPTLEGRVGASLGVELGPISGSVKRMGLRVPIEFPQDRNGNFGAADVDFAFLSPAGFGCSFQDPLSGGGFLEFDDLNKRYAGILGLTFGEIGITAIGLITTKMPDGSDGFSMLINLGVVFDPCIELASGFKLCGVGGLIGINRSMEIEVLQRGIRNKTLDSILFPDPATVVANANKIISDLRAVFPPAQDRFVVGPMVKIGYGQPDPIITADIGIFLELFDPIRIVFMGQVEATYPDKEEPIVLIHLDVLGVLDFEKELLTFQASLYDSRILTFEVFGDSAFLLKWGNNPRFALSLGGFHPKFTPPPPPIIFADLKRLTVKISESTDFELVCQAYQALTPNSLQFGARVDLYAASGGAEVTGYMGFEALIYFSPFTFEAWIGAAVQIKFEGQTLADVELSFTLAGPGAWSAIGKATIKILFIDIDVGFEEHWGDDAVPTLRAADAWEPLKKALAAPGNWAGVLPPDLTLVETFRERKGEEPAVVLHPAGSVEVRQTVVPLEVALQKVGNAPVTGHDLFDLTGIPDDEEVPDASRELVIEPIEEFFSRGQFENLSQNRMLSAPDFERMKGGVRARLEEALSSLGGFEEAAVGYESILIGEDRIETNAEKEGASDWRADRSAIGAHAFGRRRERLGHRARYAEPRTTQKVRCTEERFCIANAADLTRAQLPEDLPDNGNMTRMRADQVLADVLALDPTRKGALLVASEFELEEVT